MRNNNRALEGVVLLFLLAAGISHASASENEEFKSFFEKFHTAIIARDRESVRTMLAPEIVYTFGRMWPGDRRDGAIKTWDERDRWPELEQVLKQGYAARPDGGFVAPPSALHPTHAEKAQLRIVFAQEGGDWKVVTCVAGL